MLHFNAGELILAIGELDFEQPGSEFRILIGFRRRNISNDFHDLQDQSIFGHLEFALGLGGEAGGTDFTEISLRGAGFFVKF